jgi:hypothetical protein
MIIDITIMNLNIGYQRWIYQKSALSTDTSSSVFQQFTLTQRLASLDIMTQLQNSKNRKKTLSDYLIKIKQSNQYIQILKSKLTQEIAEQTKKYNDCQASKLQWDGLYYQGIDQLNTYDLKNGLEQSIDYGKCAIEHRIRANAASALYNKLIVYTQVLTYRYSLLSANQDLIVSNFNMFKDSYLEKLMVVRDTFGRIPESAEIK